MTNGQVVFISGAQGNRPTVSLASTSSHDTAHYTIGILTCNIADNNTGYATTQGLVRGLDCSGFDVGDVV